MTDANINNNNNNNNNNNEAQLASKFQPGPNSPPTTTTTMATTTTKPRLSLLSASKQSGMRINSDDHPDQQQTITILTGTHDDFVGVNSSSNQTDENLHVDRLKSENVDNDNNKNSNETTAQSAGRNTQSEESNRMNISKEDLIRLLSMLKSELQSKEIALAAIKCEQLKRLINPVEISRSSLANTYIELQDRIKICESGSSEKTHNETTSIPSASNNDDTTNRTNNLVDIVNVNQTKENNNVDDEESLNILNTLLELLDRHPLLALPRDSIYCLDYNCNELSTKNYLNLKIQHLDNLINQHRRYRYYMNERLKKSEQRYLELTHQLELERLLKSEIEKSAYKATGRAILLKHIDQLKEGLEKEKSDKQVIVMTLLNELLDERERSQKLMKRIAELESTNNISSISSIDERLFINENEKVEKLEKEVGDLNSQLKKQTLNSMKEKSELEMQNSNLVTEILALKVKLEQQEVKMTALMKSISKESTSQGVTSPSSPTRTGNNKQVIPGNRINSGSSTGVISRGSTTAGSIGSAKSTLATKVTTNASSGTPSNVPQRGHSVEGSQVLSQQPGPSRVTGNQKTTDGPASGLTRIAGNNSNNETQIVRIQPLFKTTPVMSGSQQARNFKSMSTGGIGSSAVTTNQTSNNSSPNANSPRTSNNQIVTKPRVPAKPAQLLDQQRNSVN